MSPRKILRIVLIVIFLLLLWTRTGRLSRGWLIGATVLALLLLLGLLAGLFRKPRNLKDEVPQHPLGLDD
jgi:hypothetical protein